jgi:predicted phage terminase large subunit-like protein
MIKDRKVRIAITKRSHWHFFHFYFAHYVTFPTAEFHNEIFDLTENESFGNLFIVAFRGSSKSTILTTSYPIWAILGEQHKKFVLVLAKTQTQAKQYMMNLRSELESNTLLKNDLGPFREESNEWGSSTLVFSKLNVRITAASSEQGIRGLRHNQYRPDLVVSDDIEDIDSTKTREGRNKTYEWWTSEVIPIGQKNTRFVLVGNLLHEDSLLMRIKEDIENKKIDGVFKEYPLISNGVILWPGKYPSMEDIEKEKRKSNNEFAWQREYMLRIVPNNEQPIHREWIQYYNEIPTGLKDCQGYPLNTEIRIGADLAISLRDTADYTAMVPAVLLGEGNDVKIYILPGIVNRRISFPETVALCKVMTKTYYEKGKNPPSLIIESVAYQRSLPQQLESEGICNIKTSNPGNQDKHTRVVLTSNWIKSGKILFPQEGAKELINQLVNFGVEKHDDLADAFSILVLNIMENPILVPRISWV